jgi:metal-sulfur cluster biosynthetic enzyme
MSQEQPKVLWQADSTHPELSKTAREALRQVIDPEIGLNVIELGLVRDLQIEKDQAKMMMIMTTPFCPYGPALLEMARQKAEEAVRRPTMIELGMDMWEPSMMEEGAGAEWGFF